MGKTAKMGRLCDRGRHPMDPKWKTCPLCENELRAKERIHQTASDSSRGRKTSSRKTSVEEEGA
jgi:hypothetical protein